GVQRFVLRLEHEVGHTDVEVGLLSAERDPAMLFEVTRTRLEKVRLRARLGDEAVYAVAPSGDPRPERAWRRVAEGAVDIDEAPPRPPRPCWLLPRPI